MPSTGIQSLAGAALKLSTASSGGPIGNTQLANITSHYVADVNVTAASLVWLTPTNAAAALLDGSTNKPYVSAIAASSGFTIKGASTAAFVGTETYAYLRIG